MRIRHKINLNGYFWLPGSPKQRCGTLSISDGGKIRLKILGSFEEDFGKIFNPSGTEYDRISGHVEPNQNVILKNCLVIQTGFSSPINLYPTILQPQQAFLGSMDLSAPLQFTSFLFSVEGLEEWIGRSGIGRENNDVRYQFPTMPAIELDDKYELSVVPAGNKSRTQNELKISEELYFCLKSKGPQPIERFMEKSGSIVALMCVALDKVVSIQKISAELSYLKQRVNVYYKSVFFSEEIPNTFREEWLILYDELKPDAIKRWVSDFKNIINAFSLYYVDTKAKKRRLDEMLLYTARSLEALHRSVFPETTEMSADEFEKLCKDLMNACRSDKHKEWLGKKLKHANDPTFRKRLEGLIEPFNSFLQRRTRHELIQGIVDVRNRLTHPGDDMPIPNEQPKIEELYNLLLSMGALLKINLFQLMGIDVETIKKIIKSKPDVWGFFNISEDSEETLNSFTDESGG